MSYDDMRFALKGLIPLSEQISQYLNFAQYLLDNNHGIVSRRAMVLFRLIGIAADDILNELVGLDIHSKDFHEKCICCGKEIKEDAIVDIYCTDCSKKKSIIFNTFA